MSLLFNKNNNTLRDWWFGLPAIWRIFFYKQGHHYTFEENHLKDEQLEANALNISEKALTYIYNLQKFNLDFAYDTCLLSDIDLTPLTQLPKLQEISLYQVQIASLEPLAQIKNLKSLALSGPHEWKWNSDPPFFPFEFNRADIAPLLKLPNLQALYFFGNTGFLDLNLDWIARLQSLRLLTLANSELTQIEDISPISKLPYLHHLDIVDTNVKKISPLKDSAIKILLVNRNNVLLEDIKKLKKAKPDCEVKICR